MPPTKEKVTLRFVILVLIIICSFFLSLVGRMTGKEFQSLMTLAVTIYGGVGYLERKRKEKKDIDDE